MKVLTVILAVCLALLDDIKAIEVEQIYTLFKSNKNAFSANFGATEYNCREVNKIHYCIDKADDILLIQNHQRGFDKNYYTQYFDLKTGKILKEGYSGGQKSILIDQPVGVWKVYDYNYKKIKYINFNKKPKYDKYIIKKWAQKSGSKKSIIVIARDIYNKKSAWRVVFGCMDVYIDSNNGRILNIKIHRGEFSDKVYKEKYRCALRNLQKGYSVKVSVKKCKLRCFAGYDR